MPLEPLINAIPVGRRGTVTQSPQYNLRAMLAVNSSRNYADFQPIKFYHFLNTKRILLPIMQQVKLIFIRVSEAKRHDEISRCSLLVLDFCSLLSSRGPLVGMQNTK